MDRVEVSGRTLDEAVQIAAQELGVPTDAIDYEVAEEGTKGFLGFGGTPTVVTAWVKKDYTPGEAVTVQPEPVGEEVKAEEVEAEPVNISEPVSLEGISSDDFSNRVMKVLDDVVGAMDLDAKPVLKLVGEEDIEIELVGRDVSILVGKGGQTLDALQYLMAIAANKGTTSKRRVVLDAEGYRERHRRSLEKIAREYADAVKEKGREAVLDPQPARDRRIIHMFLVDDPDVYTYSEGYGDDRHVVISPKK